MVLRKSEEAAHVRGRLVLEGLIHVRENVLEEKRIKEEGQEEADEEGEEEK